MLAFYVALAADSLAISDLGLLELNLYVELRFELGYYYVEVLLAHTGDNELLGLGVGDIAYSGILFS